MSKLAASPGSGVKFKKCHGANN
ncbi:TPA: SEC-C domain-containing protein [Klebsiella pneumoniae]|nr:hypothetical protein [Klebsiella pneumoniae]MBE0135751.1 hypothetical protein [Klebsiella michiganensis]HAJ1281477.1 hypothetical protein [Escherichia coli]HBB6750866.1 SEC-C domain-containing protein [Citrobacter freundii]MBE0205477.1 hypothetical protein [Klebsiella michiganensis]